MLDTVVAFLWEAVGPMLHALARRYRFSLRNAAQLLASEGFVQLPAGAAPAADALQQRAGSRVSPEAKRKAKRVRCPICDRFFVNKYSMARHRDTSLARNNRCFRRAASKTGPAGSDRISGDSDSDSDSDSGGFPAGCKLATLAAQPIRTSMVHEFVGSASTGAAFVVVAEALLEFSPPGEDEQPERVQKRFHLQRRTKQSSAVRKSDKLSFVTPCIGGVDGSAAANVLHYDTAKLALTYLINHDWWEQLQAVDMNGRQISSVAQLETFYDGLIGKDVPVDLIEFEYATHYVSAHFKNE